MDLYKSNGSSPPATFAKLRHFFEQPYNFTSIRLDSAEHLGKIPPAYRVIKRGASLWLVNTAAPRVFVNEGAR